MSHRFLISSGIELSLPSDPAIWAVACSSLEKSSLLWDRMTPSPQVCLRDPNIVANKFVKNDIL